MDLLQNISNLLSNIAKTHSVPKKGRPDVEMPLPVKVIQNPGQRNPELISSDKHFQFQSPFDLPNQKEGLLNLQRGKSSLATVTFKEPVKASFSAVTTSLPATIQNNKALLQSLQGVIIAVKPLPMEQNGAMHYNTTIQTQHGNIILRLDAPLPLKSEVKLSLVSPQKLQGLLVMELLRPNGTSQSLQNLANSTDKVEGKVLVNRERLTTIGLREGRLLVSSSTKFPQDLPVTLKLFNNFGTITADITTDSPLVKLETFVSKVDGVLKSLTYSNSSHQPSIDKTIPAINKPLGELIRALLPIQGPLSQSLSQLADQLQSVQQLPEFLSLKKLFLLSAKQLHGLSITAQHTSTTNALNIEKYLAQFGIGPESPPPSSSDHTDNSIEALVRAIRHIAIAAAMNIKRFSTIARLPFQHHATLPSQLYLSPLSHFMTARQKSRSAYSLSQSYLNDMLVTEWLKKINAIYETTDSTLAKLKLQQVNISDHQAHPQAYELPILHKHQDTRVEIEYQTSHENDENQKALKQIVLKFDLEKLGLIKIILGFGEASKDALDLDIHCFCNSTGAQSMIMENMEALKGSLISEGIHISSIETKVVSLQKQVFKSTQHLLNIQA